MRPPLSDTSRTVKVTYKVTEEQRSTLEAYTAAHDLGSASAGLRHLLDSLNQSSDLCGVSSDDWEFRPTIDKGSLSPLSPPLHTPPLTPNPPKRSITAETNDRKPANGRQVGAVRGLGSSSSRGAYLAPLGSEGNAVSGELSSIGYGAKWGGRWPPPVVECPDAERLAGLAADLRKKKRPRSRGDASRWVAGIRALLLWGPQAQPNIKSCDPEGAPSAEEIEQALRGFYGAYKPAGDGYDWFRFVDDGQALWRLWKTWAPSMLMLYEEHATEIHPEGFWPDIVGLAERKAAGESIGYPPHLPVGWSGHVDHAITALVNGDSDGARATFLRRVGSEYS